MVAGSKPVELTEKKIIKMARSTFKGPYTEIENPKDLNEGKEVYRNQILKVKSRKSTILPSLVGNKVAIHNGKEYKTITITTNHVGHKFGEFAITKIPAVYKRKSLKKRK